MVTAAGPFPLPAPVVMGAGGRAPPTSNVCPNCPGVGHEHRVDRRAAVSLRAHGNAIDYFESLESMRVRVNNPVAVSGFVSFEEFWVLGDNGAGATGRNARGGVTISAGDRTPSASSSTSPAAAPPPTSRG